LTATRQTGWRRLIIRWTGAKGLMAILLFFIVTIIVEVVFIYGFQTLGLVDNSVWVAKLLVPYTKSSLTISISPLFHLLPISVIIVLIASWAYLTKYTAFIPQRPEQAKRFTPPSRRLQESRRFKSLRRLSKRLTKRLEKTGLTIKSGFQRIPGVSYLSQRLHFARAAIRSALTVLIVFICIAFLMVIVEYPDLIRNATVNMYQGSISPRGVVLGVSNWLEGIGKAAPPLGGLGTRINNGLVGAGPRFRQSLQSAGSAVTAGIVQLNVSGKYTLSQNLAAWISALTALTYGAYVSSRMSRRPKGR
jgi:hypothetical protein